MRTSNLVSRVLGSLKVRGIWNHLRAVPFLGSVLHYLAQRILPPGPVWVVIQGGPLRGKRFLCDPRFHWVYIRGDYEPWMVEWLKNFLYPGGTFVDVGAHIGYFTLIAADIVGPKGHVIAFEPDPRNASILTANVNSAGKDDMVKIVRAAVGAKSGTILFQSGHDYCSRIAAEGECSETIVVVQRTLNEFDLPQGTVIKVDVEGAEVDVLQGATNHLEDKKTTWIIEAHGSDLEQTIITILRQYGYYPEVHAPVHPALCGHRQRYVLAIGF